jgi:hypothetical protein
MGRNGAVSDADAPKVPKKAAINRSGYADTSAKITPVSAIRRGRMASVRRRPQRSACSAMRYVLKKSPTSETVMSAPMPTGVSPRWLSATPRTTPTRP